MFLDKHTVDSIQDPEHRHMMLLILFAANKNAKNLSFNIFDKFFLFLFRRAFVESKKCVFAASLKVYQFYAHVKDGFKVALYLIPMSDSCLDSLTGHANSSVSADNLSYMVFYSINKGKNREMILQEDFNLLFRQLRDLGELEHFVNDLERYKLIDS